MIGLHIKSYRKRRSANMCCFFFFVFENFSQAVYATI